MFKKLLKKKIFRYLICGVVTAAFNVLLISAIIELFGINKPVMRNLANVLSIEVSLLFSFFVYRTWVWSKGNWTIKEVIWRQIPLFHLSIGASIGIRSFIVFPILDWLGVHYTINTLVGILFGSIINYKISDRWVFKPKR
ncbi:MAG: GtrA family protein [Cyanobacteria bacterium P01_H01_bin.35]